MRIFRHRWQLIVTSILLFAAALVALRASILADEGINVARRTVAKYREAMKIPSSSERKRRKPR